MSAAIQELHAAVEAMHQAIKERDEARAYARELTDAYLEASGKLQKEIQDWKNRDIYREEFIETLRDERDSLRENIKASKAVIDEQQDTFGSLYLSGEVSDEDVKKMGIDIEQMAESVRERISRAQDRLIIDGMRLDFREIEAALKRMETAGCTCGIIPESDCDYCEEFTTIEAILKKHLPYE